MKTKIYKIKDLISAEYNPRKISDKQIRELQDSIKRFGFVEPVIVNIHEDRKNIIISGHQRVRAANDLGIEEVPCLELNLTLDKEKELNVRMNKAGGEFDFDLLKDFGKDLLFDIGFEDFELDKMFPIEVGEQDDVVPETAKNEYGVVRGDIWQLGNHRLMCGDSTKIDDVEKLLDGKKADMYLTDPPYNVDYTGKTKEALKIDNDKKDDLGFRHFLKDAFQNADIYMKPGAVFYIWHADSEGYNFRGACFDIGWKVRQCIIWNKDTMVMGRQDYHWQHEPCLYGWKDGASHLWNADRKQTTVWNFERPRQNKEHPTMKPVELLAYQLCNNTKGEDLVLDTFLGSGSTLIACDKTNRICYGMELDEHYCSVIIKRWEEFTNKKACKL